MFNFALSSYYVGFYLLNSDKKLSPTNLELEIAQTGKILDECNCKPNGIQ